MDKAEQPTITQAQYESAIKGRQDFRNAYRNLLPVLRAAEELSRLWRTKGRLVDDEVFFNAINAVDVAVTGGGAKPDPEHLTRTTSPAAQDGLVEALEWISKICDEEITLEYNDAMRKAFQRNIRDAANKALSAIKEQHHD